MKVMFNMGATEPKFCAAERAVCESAATGARGTALRIERFVLAHPKLLPSIHAGMIAFYLALILIPPLLPTPGEDATPFRNFVRFSQFAIWCVWWPFVLLSMIALGRGWCGIFCPEGALAASVSRFAAHRRVPKWMSWGGIPLVAFLAITIIGQLLEVDEEPVAQLVVLGGSTLLACVVSLRYTRNSRVWCRYLCPVSLLFGVFSRLGAMSFRVDRKKLEAHSAAATEGAKKEPCPVFIHLPVLSTNRDCLMCFGCAGWRDAIHLSFRRPGEELERIDTANPLLWEVVFLFGGAIGLPLGVFSGEAFKLERVQLLAALLASTACAIGLLSLLTWIAALMLRLTQATSVPTRKLFARLGYAYAPLSLFSLFLGLSQPTFAYLRGLGFPQSAADLLRAMLLVGGGVWTLLLARRIQARSAKSDWHLSVAMLPQLAGAAIVLAAWTRVLWLG